jgi:hypothetical protein
VPLASGGWVFKAARPVRDGRRNYGHKRGK